MGGSESKSYETDFFNYFKNNYRKIKITHSEDNQLIERVLRDMLNGHEYNKWITVLRIEDSWYESASTFINKEYNKLLTHPNFTTSTDKANIFKEYFNEYIESILKKYYDCEIFPKILNTKKYDIIRVIEQQYDDFLNYAYDYVMRVNNEYYDVYKSFLPKHIASKKNMTKRYPT